MLRAKERVNGMTNTIQRPQLCDEARQIIPGVGDERGRGGRRQAGEVDDRQRGEVDDSRASRRVATTLLEPRYVFFFLFFPIY
jgi:hypothetical protein